MMTTSCQTREPKEGIAVLRAAKFFVVRREKGQLLCRGGVVVRVGDRS